MGIVKLQNSAIPNRKEHFTPKTWDLANKKGTAVLTPADGIVVLAKKNLYFAEL